ncbi:MAG: hypothetical protein NC911_01750, partial [Candidatus Omnitrophica bacterium]|nr:hypothetical protein [Candidatus Omnitrophota bacterium]
MKKLYSKKIRAASGLLSVSIILTAIYPLLSAPKVQTAWYQSQFPQAGIPLMSQPPVIDGRFDLEEWKQALAFTGLYSRWAYILPAEMQGWVFVGYDQK